MDLKICKDADAVAAEANLWLEAKTRNRVRTRVYIPAGNTPKPLYALWRRSRPAYLNTLRLHQIDDVLTGRQAGLFRHFLEEELAPWKEQIEWMEGGETQAEVALLGLGINGHVAFHEPNIHASFFSGCVPLSEVTTTRLGVEPGTWGVTYGVGAFRSCQALLMMVTGAEKRPLLREMVSGRGLFPAMGLVQHANFLVVADRAAAP